MNNRIPVGRDDEGNTIYANEARPVSPVNNNIAHRNRDEPHLLPPRRNGFIIFLGAVKDILLVVLGFLALHLPKIFAVVIVIAAIYSTIADGMPFFNMLLMIGMAVLCFKFSIVGWLLLIFVIGYLIFS